MRTFICVIFLINNYGLLFSQQTIGLLLADSLIIKDFDKQLFYTDYVGKHRKSFNFSEGYYVLRDSNEFTKACLKNFFTKDSILFHYGEFGRAISLSYNLKTKKFEKEVIYGNKYRLQDIKTVYPKIYLLFWSYSKNKNLLYELDVEKQNQKVYDLTKIKHVRNCYFHSLDYIQKDLWIYGQTNSSRYEFCLLKFNAQTINKIKLYKIFKHPLPLNDVILKKYLDVGSDFLCNGQIFPLICHNISTNYLLELAGKRVIGTFTNPHHGFAAFEQLLKGPVIVCGGGVESLKYQLNSYQYSGIKRFELDGKQYFCQQALAPVKITQDMIRKTPFNIPLQYYLTIWDDSLNIVADIPMKEKLIDISEAGAFTIRYDGDDAVIYRYRIEFSENSLNENTQR